MHVVCTIIWIIKARLVLSTLDHSLSRRSRFKRRKATLQARPNLKKWWDTNTNRWYCHVKWCNDMKIILITRRTKKRASKPKSKCQCTASASHWRARTSSRWRRSARTWSRVPRRRSSKSSDQCACRPRCYASPPERRRAVRAPRPGIAIRCAFTSESSICTVPLKSSNKS